MPLFSITNRGLTPNPSYNARFIGVLYVVLLVFDPFNLIYIPVTVYVLDDPITTANNITANQGRLGLFSTSILVVVEILICAQLFQLFRYLRTTVLMARFRQDCSW